MPPPDVVRPTPDGNVALEWVHEVARLEFEISEDSLEIMLFDSAGKTTYEQVSIG
jgi:hypothetical protein